MNSRSDLIKVVSEFLSILIAFLGLLILIGWMFNIPLLLHPGSGFSAIKSNAGLAFLLIGVSLWFVQTKKIKFHNQGIAQILAFIVLIIGFLTLMEYIFNLNIGIDQILFKEAVGALNTSSPNRMALTTVINFILAGICILLWDVKTPRVYRPTQIFAIIGGFISLIGFLAYIYNASLFYHIPQFTAISIYATIIFILLFGAILLARPDTGIMSIINSNDISGVLARRLLPLIIILPIIFGLISRYGVNIGLYNEQLADILFLFFIIIFLTIIVWITIISIKKIDDDRRLLEIEYQVSLEENVKDRTKELEQSNKDLQQFAYVASHDLREPLRMITSFLQLLERRYYDQLDEDANEFIGFAVNGAKRLDYMINDLLEYSRVANTKREFSKVDVNKVLEYTILNLKSAIDDSSAEITYDALPTLFADEQLMILLFQNLISNSIKYRREEIPKISISAIKESNQYLFTVKDNGIGMSPKHLKKIFTIFQRLHTKEEYEGTGIGLAITQKIVHQHAGEIWVESEPGKGSTFYFTIPINE
ncbi:ATP-binding protein [Methanobacterium sp. SMA-27]|uniref:sensor histidine kinase n=1 Tax=Methanobacterium sp. SMA-27 TaxID=1495336 RepID=UPI000694FB85|nr:ATP-binding protein [Methanobacterium sp. SMA-27]